MARRQRGFTLVETVLVIALLALAAAGLKSLYPQVFRAQNHSRDAYVGIELMHGCAERLLAVRRLQGYAKVATSVCGSALGNFTALGGSMVGVSVTLLDDASKTSVSTCGSAGATCTATISISSGLATALAPLTLQLSAY